MRRSQNAPTSLSTFLTSGFFLTVFSLFFALTFLADCFYSTGIRDSLPRGNDLVHS